MDISLRTREHIKVALADNAAASELINLVEEAANIPEVDPLSLKKTNNLSDLTDASVARTNLGGVPLTSSVFLQSAFINTSAGIADAGKPVKLDATGKLDSSIVSGTGDFLADGSIPMTGAIQMQQGTGEWDITAEVDDTTLTLHNKIAGGAILAIRNSLKNETQSTFLQFNALGELGDANRSYLSVGYSGANEYRFEAASSGTGTRKDMRFAADGSIGANTQFVLKTSGEVELGQGPLKFGQDSSDFSFFPLAATTTDFFFQNNTDSAFTRYNFLSTATDNTDNVVIDAVSLGLGANDPNFEALRFIKRSAANGGSGDIYTEKSGTGSARALNLGVGLTNMQNSQLTLNIDGTVDMLTGDVEIGLGQLLIKDGTPGHDLESTSAGVFTIRNNDSGTSSELVVETADDDGTDFAAFSLKHNGVNSHMLFRTSSTDHLIQALGAGLEIRTTGNTDQLLLNADGSINMAVGPLNFNQNSGAFSLETIDATHIELKNTGAGLQTIFNMGSADSDGTDSVLTKYFRLGEQGDANTEAFLVGYDISGIDGYSIVSAQTGSGSLRDIRIGMSDLVVKTDGTIEIGFGPIRAQDDTLNNVDNADDLTIRAGNKTNAGSSGNAGNLLLSAGVASGSGADGTIQFGSTLKDVDIASGPLTLSQSTGTFDIESVSPGHVLRFTSTVGTNENARYDFRDTDFDGTETTTLRVENGPSSNLALISGVGSTGINSVGGALFMQVNGSNVAILNTDASFELPGGPLLFSQGSSDEYQISVTSDDALTIENTEAGVATVVIKQVATAGHDLESSNAGTFTLRSKTAGSFAALAIRTFDNDGTDFAQFTMFHSATSFLTMNTNSTDHVISASGGGLEIKTSGNVDQLLINTDGSIKMDTGNLDLTGGELFVDSVQVVSNGVTGWTAATGTADRTTFVTGSATTTSNAEHIKALIDDLIAHGLIGA